MRYGGERFEVLLGGTDLRGLEHLPVRILAAVESVEFSEGLHLTVSIGGGSIIPERGRKGQWFLESVDRALYQARANGRNCYKMIPVQPDERVKEKGKSGCG